MDSKIIWYIAKIFSGIFNPFIIPTIGFLILIRYIPGSELFSEKLKYFLYITVFVSTCVMPLLFILTLRFSPYFHREMNHHRDRMLPYFFTAFCVFMGAQLLGKLPIPGIFRVFLLGASIVLVILFFVTIRWKISGHSAGIGGLTGMCVALVLRYGIDLIWVVVALFLVSGFVGASRIYLQKHSPEQVYVGFAISFCCLLLLMLFI